MSWMDFDDVRKNRGTSIKKWPVYEDGAKVAKDARMAERNHRKAMEEQRKAEALVREKADQKAKLEREKREEKARKKAARKRP